MDLGTTQPLVTLAEGIPLLTKTLGFQVEQIQATTLEVELRDKNTGRLVSLAGSGSSSSSSSSPASSSSGANESFSIKAKILEALTDGSREAPFEATGAVVNAEKGAVRIPIPAAALELPGIYRFDVGLFNSSKQLLLVNTLYMYVNRNLFGGDNGLLLGPPTVNELRQKLRDSDINENFLLADREFDIADLCLAIASMVSDYNHTMPPSHHRDTTTFQYPEAAYAGITGHLYRMKSLGYLRDHLPYNGAGLEIDDKRKYDEYQKIGEVLLQEFRRWCQLEQYRLDTAGAMQVVQGRGRGNNWYF